MFPSVLPTPRSQPAASIPSLRWGIIGPGWNSRTFCEIAERAEPATDTGRRFPLTGKGGLLRCNLGIPSAYGDVNDMLARDDLDAIYVATPHNHHFPDGCRVLRADKHVLIEKPFALNAREGVALQELAQLHGKLAMEAMWCDYLPKYDVIRQLLEDGVLGDVHTLLADHGEFFTPDHRIFNADLAGGPMMDLGSYLVSFSVLIGGAPQDIIARGEPAPGGINGQTSMLFTHDNGLHSVLNTTLFSNTPAALSWRDGMQPSPSMGNSMHRATFHRPPARAEKRCIGKNRSPVTHSCSIKRNILPGASARG